MKANELLKEYIFIDEPATTGKTLVFLYKKKYLVFVNSETPPPSYAQFKIGNELNRRLKEIFSNEDFDNSYGSVKPDNKEILKRHKDEIKSIILKNSELENKDHYGPQLAKIFYDELKNKSADDIIANMDSITYGTNAVKTKDDLDNFDKINLHISVLGPMTYAVIDHDQKTIQQHDKSREYKSRMGSYGTSDATYILPRADWSIDTDDYIKIINSLKKRFPDYTVIDDERFSKMEQDAKKIILGKGSVYAYHGTSNTIWNQIKTKNRMVPGLGPDYSDKIEGHSENMIYFTLDPDVARRYAIRASKSNKYVILKVKINDLTKLRFDEDSLMKTILKMLESKKTIDRKILEIFSKHNIDIRTYVRYPKFAGKYGLEPEVRKELDRLSRYIHYKALTGMNELSFAYEGYIPLKNIEVHETNKTKRYYMDKTTDQDYDEVEKGFTK